MVEGVGQRRLAVASRSHSQAQALAVPLSDLPNLRRRNRRRNPAPPVLCANRLTPRNGSREKQS